ncbi:unnamed protein product [Paramecium sonneborni]|uniref:Uncharacterized protein n=1 Tax=Paramecium sonneborni TaxID=65129 RepID=A0A8S1LHY1_9CILI|nr:unnamed protein product [Paramecium sonneborni]
MVTINGFQLKQGKFIKQKFIANKIRYKEQQFKLYQKSQNIFMFKQKITQQKSGLINNQLKNFSITKSKINHYQIQFSSQKYRSSKKLKYDLFQKKMKDQLLKLDKLMKLKVRLNYSVLYVISKILIISILNCC